MDNSKEQTDVSAAGLLGNPDYLAISYGGYRHVDHDIEPTIDELKDDMKLLSAMGIKILRTYKVHLPQASNILKAISELRNEDASFEMYVMLGAWISCEGAFNSSGTGPNHDSEAIVANTAEIETAISLANQYPDIVKVLAVGNEAMVKWATSYYVQPKVILKWVNHLQELKKLSKLPSELWITSSDNFASWGGGGSEYHVEDLTKLIKAVDYISMHTYPMHDTHYNPDFWGAPVDDELTDIEKINVAMLEAKEYAVAQYQSVLNYVKSLGIDKAVHIGETGWASVSNGFYGETGSKATDEYKEALYYNLMRDWTNKAGISCFYFEAFDEQWKDAHNGLGSENHFGLINLKSQAKYALWSLVDQGVFDGLSRDGMPITKTYNGDINTLMKYVKVPPVKAEKNIKK